MHLQLHNTIRHCTYSYTIQLDNARTVTQYNHTIQDTIYKRTDTVHTYKLHLSWVPITC
jgi:hypothetical protein